MDKKEFQKHFEKNVSYIQRTIPPDDIYPFAEQTLMASLYFLRKLNDYADLTTLANEDLVFQTWITNIGTFLIAQERELDLILDLKIDELDE